MANETTPRTYRSPLREEAARQTRRAILKAAHELFVANGYGATSLDAIAARAGVSKPTVFAAVGNKATVLKEVRELAMAGDDEPVPVSEQPAYRELYAEPDAYRTVRLIARNTTALLARYAELDDVLHAAADADADLRQLWETSEAQRLAAARTYVRNLTGKSELKPGVDEEVAIDLVWLLLAPSHYHRLVHGRKWSPARFEQWLGDVLTYQLLRARPSSTDATNERER